MILRPNWQFLLLSRIKRGQWLVSERYAEDMMPLVTQLLSGQLLSASPAENIQVLASAGERFLDTPQEKKCYAAIIPLSGTMLKYGTMCSAGTVDVAEAICYHARQNECSALVLEIDSGGGSIDSIPCMVDAIAYCRKQGKPVVASIDLCASAAYWIASCCDHIMAQNTLCSEIGSVGAYATFVDNRTADEKAGLKFHYIYPPESADKNRMYRDALDGDFSMMEGKVSETARRFQNAVRANRPNLQADVQGVLTGKMFPAEEALSVGLIDSIGNLTLAVRMALDLAEIRKFNQ